MKKKEKKSYGIFFYLVFTFVGKYLPTLLNSFRKIKTLCLFSEK